MNKLMELYKQNKEKIMYLFFGVLTTIFCLGLKFLLEKCFGIVGGYSVIIAEPLAMLFAYVTNKIWVFESKCKNLSELVKEMLSFFSARIFTIFLSWFISFIFVDKLHFNNMFIQIVAAVIVVILNYVFSKIFIFKKDKK